MMPVPVLRNHGGDRPSIGDLVTYATAILTGILLVIGFFSDRVFTFMSARPYFQALVILLLLEILWALQRRPPQGLIVLQEDEFYGELTKLVHTQRIERARVLAAGMVALNGPIQQLCDGGIPVEVLCQHPETAVDRRDGDRVLDMIDGVLYHLKESAFLDLLHGRFSRDVATVRGVWLTTRRENVEYLFIGWYTYTGIPGKIRGRRNPVLMATSATEHGRTLIRFFTKLFEDRWNRAEEWPSPRTKTAADP